jgi:chorismate dehydratase
MNHRTSRVSTEKVKACAVKYLNTVPLVWGMLHGEQQGQFDITFGVPAQTAEVLKAGEADIGIVSSIELPRQKLGYVPGLGIASRGAVRSIFLITKKPISEIRTLAADANSRTSVALSRIVLKHRFHVEPEVLSAPPDLSRMLAGADAALIIGDPALRLDLSSLSNDIYDLGQEWTAMTGLPMVYAVWAVRDDSLASSLKETLLDSYYFGRDHLEDIIKIEAVRRGFSEVLARQYLTEHIVFELGSMEQKGLELFLRYASNLNLV